MKLLRVYIPRLPRTHKHYPIVRQIRRNLREILRHPGEWVLVNENGVAGYFKTWKDGIEEGYRRFGLGEFFVQEVNSLTKPKFVGANLTSVGQWIKEFINGDLFIERKTA